MVPIRHGILHRSRREAGEVLRGLSVRACDLYVGIIGSRYGSPVRDRPEVSYTELEFESASKSPAMKRLVFLLDENALVPLGLFNDQQYGESPGNSPQTDKRRGGDVQGFWRRART